MILRGCDHKGPLDEEFDHVVVGSGAAGATIARVLADTGKSVCILEEGPDIPTEDLGDEAWPAFRDMCRETNGQVAQGRAIKPLIQGCVVGGSTLINSAIMWRMPEDVWEPWAKEWGLGEALPLEALHQNWDQLEEELHIRPTPPELWGPHNQAMARGSEAMGIQAAPTARAEAGCKASALCLTGCVHGAKQSMHVSYIPRVLQQGGQVIANARVQNIRFTGDRASAVEGQLLTGPGGRPHAPFTLRARTSVIVAASAIQTPLLLHKSGLRNGHIGRHFLAHPGCPIMAEFHQPMDPWFGATQGYDLDHYRREHRFKIETISLPPEIMLARLPGVGAALRANISRAPHLLSSGVQLRAYAEGRVKKGLLGTSIKYTLEQRDMENLRTALRVTAEMYFAAGARAVLPGIYGLPTRLESPDELKLLDAAPLDPRCYSFIVTHLFGTARMAPRAEDGVVDTDFTVHGTQNLYVVDSSIFPTNLGVNPQLAIMGVAMEAGKRIAERA